MDEGLNTLINRRVNGTEGHTIPHNTHSHTRYVHAHTPDYSGKCTQILKGSPSTKVHHRAAMHTHYVMTGESFLEQHQEQGW